ISSFSSDSSLSAFALGNFLSLRLSFSRAVLMGFFGSIFVLLLMFHYCFNSRKTVLFSPVDFSDLMMAEFPDFLHDVIDFFPGVVFTEGKADAGPLRVGTNRLKHM